MYEEYETIYTINFVFEKSLNSMQKFKWRFLNGANELIFANNKIFHSILLYFIQCSFILLQQWDLGINWYSETK